MPDEVADAIRHATLDVFAMMVGVEVQPQSGLECHPKPLEMNIVSTFHLSGVVCGTAEVYYTFPLATRMTRQMLQVEGPVADADVLDAAGEVANMVIGNVKNCLERRWGLICIGTPKVAISSSGPQGNQSSSVTFRCGDDLFTVSVAFKEAFHSWQAREALRGEVDSPVY
jgi:chemotaxis protein CheX